MGKGVIRTLFAIYGSPGNATVVRRDGFVSIITSVIDTLVFTQRQPERTRTAVIDVDDETKAAFGTAAVRRAHLGCRPHGRASAGAL